MSRRRIAIISTGGTIEKTYDELSGLLANHVSVLDVMLAGLMLEGVSIDRIALMKKDSLEMDDADHDTIAATAIEAAASHDGVIVVHGTDRLQFSGERTHAAGPPAAPVVFTGAMRPYELRDTDALQNLTEALMAVQLLPAGVYAVMHNRVHRFPGVTKDRDRGTFTSG